MPSPMATLPFAAKPAPATASPGGASPVKDDASAPPKTAFDDLVRRPPKRDDAAPRKPATASTANDASDRPRDRVEGAGRGKDGTAKRTKEEDASTDTAPVALAPLLDLAAPAITPVDPGTVVLADPLAAPLPNGTTASDPALSPDMLLGERSTAPALPAPPAAGGTPQAAEASATDTNASATAAPGPAATDAQAKVPLQNLLSFATHLAAGQVAAALPDAINLGRDIADALRSDDSDTAVPTGNLLAGVGASHAPLGLSRTDTVNAMEAPSADLHGGRFDEDIGDAVRWMADQKIGHAHIKVTPNDLGTVEIRLRLEGDRVHADFASTQAEVRQALESSLPRLRDMLGQHGFQLAHADVGQQHAPPSQGTASSHPGEDGPGPADTSADTPRTVRMTALGLLDAYA